MGERRTTLPADYRAEPVRKETELTVSTPKKRVEGVEFSRLSTEIEPQEILQNTVAFLVDLKRTVDDEVNFNRNLTDEQKKAISEAHAKLHLFIYSILGVDSKFGGKTLNERALRINLEDIPEDIFRSIALLAREIPEVYDELFEDPARFHTSEVFNPQYHLLYTLFQRALREVSNTTSFSEKNNCRVERVTLLAEARAQKREHRIDRSKPMPVDLSEVNDERMTNCLDNLIGLIEKKEEELPKDLRKDIQSLLSFLRTCSSPELATVRLQERNVPNDERAFFTRYADFVSRPESLDMAVLPVSVVEAASRIGMVDHEIHLALLGHNVHLDQSALVDSSGQQVSSFEREHAYHPLSIAASNTVKKEVLSKRYASADGNTREEMERTHDSRYLAGPTIAELYKLDDLLATGSNGDLVKMVSAKDYAQLVAILGSHEGTTPQTVFSRVWGILNTPIEKLFRNQQSRRREERDRATVDGWVQALRGNWKYVLGQQDSYEGDLIDRFIDSLGSLLKELGEHPNLERVDLVEAILDRTGSFAKTQISPNFAADIEKLGQRYLPHETLGKSSRISSAEFMEKIQAVFLIMQNFRSYNDTLRIGWSIKSAKAFSRDSIVIEEDKEKGMIGAIIGGFCQQNRSSKDMLRYFILDIIEIMSKRVSVYDEKLATEISTLAKHYEADDLFGNVHFDSGSTAAISELSVGLFPYMDDAEILQKSLRLIRKIEHYLDHYTPPDPQKPGSRGKTKGTSGERGQDGEMKDDFYTTGGFTGSFKIALNKMRGAQPISSGESASKDDQIIPCVVSIYLKDMLSTLEIEKIPLADEFQKYIEEVKEYFDSVSILSAEKCRYSIEELLEIADSYKDIMLLDSTQRGRSPLERLSAMRGIYEHRSGRIAALLGEAGKQDKWVEWFRAFPAMEAEFFAVLADMTTIFSPGDSLRFQQFSNDSGRFDNQRNGASPLLQESFDSVEKIMRERALEYGWNAYEVVEKKAYKKIAGLSSAEFEKTERGYGDDISLCVSPDGTIILCATPKNAENARPKEKAEVAAIQPRLFFWRYANGAWQADRKVVLTDERDEVTPRRDLDAPRHPITHSNYVGAVSDFFVTSSGDIVANIKSAASTVKMFTPNGDLIIHRQDMVFPDNIHYEAKMGHVDEKSSFHRVSDRLFLATWTNTPFVNSYGERPTGNKEQDGHTMSARVPSFSFGNSRIAVLDGELVEFEERKIPDFGTIPFPLKDTKAVRDFLLTLQENSPERLVTFHAASDTLLIYESEGTRIRDWAIKSGRVLRFATHDIASLEVSDTTRFYAGDRTEDPAFLQWGEYRRKVSKRKIVESGIVPRREEYRYLGVQIVGENRVAVHIREDLKSDKIVFLRPSQENVPSTSHATTAKPPVFWEEEQEIDTGTVFDHFKVLPDGKVIIAGSLGVGKNFGKTADVIVFDGTPVDTDKRS